MNGKIITPRLLNRSVEHLEAPDLNIIFHALSDPTRRKMLESLGKQSIPTSHLAFICNISVSLAAKHIAVLKHAGLVRKLRLGKGSVIALENISFQAAQEYIRHFIDEWDEDYQRFKRNMEAGN